jgi:hypothetical protein
MGCKIAQKKEEGVQNCTISKKIGGKSAIEHKDGVQNQKGSKKIGCKIAKKKRGGAKSYKLEKDRGEVQLSLKRIIHVFLIILRENINNVSVKNVNPPRLNS